MSSAFPNRECSHPGRRLHRTSSFHHESSISSAQPSHSASTVSAEPSSNLQRQSVVSLVSEYGATTYFATNEDQEEDLRSLTPCEYAQNNRDRGQLQSRGQEYGGEMLQVAATPSQLLDGTESDQILERTFNVRRSKDSLRERLATANIVIDYLKTQLEARPGIQPAPEVPGENYEAKENVKTDYVSETSAETTTALVVWVVLMPLLMIACCYICWWNGPEMSYIRQRRRDVFNL